MKLRKAFYKFLVWNMDWMVRVFGFVPRYFINIYANNEVIACGLHESDGTLKIIFTPSHKHAYHRLKSIGTSKVENEHAQKTPIDLHPYKNPLIYSFSPSVAEGVTLQVLATYKGRSFLNQISSPYITVKAETIDLKNVMHYDGTYIEWRRAEKYKPMIYFLILLDRNKNSIAGVYMTGTSWKVGSYNNVALIVGDLKRIESCANLASVELMLIDFEGWVSHRAALLLNHPTLEGSSIRAPTLKGRSDVAL